MTDRTLVAALHLLLLVCCTCCAALHLYGHTTVVRINNETTEPSEIGREVQ